MHQPDVRAVIGIQTGPEPVPPEATRDAWPLWLHEHTHGLPCSEQTYKELKAAFLGGWQAAARYLAAEQSAPTYDEWKASQ